jgi:methylglutaconyl-CoA hydratase
MNGMDESIHRLTTQLSHTSAEAVAELKRVLWKGTDDWDHLLSQRAKISGRLVLSDFTKEAIMKFKNSTR